MTIKYISSFQKPQNSMQKLGTIDLTLDDVTTSSRSGATHNEVIDLTLEEI